MYFVDEHSVVDENCTIGDGTKIWHFSHIIKGTKIGKNCVIGQNCMIGPNVTIGNGCKIQNNVSVYYDVTLEDDVFIGPSVVFTNVNNPRAFINRMNETKQTLIKKGASIGANATIVCGHTIGNYAFVGAGSVVTKDVPDFALVVGNPAKIIGWICECGNKIDFKFKIGKCPACQKEYEAFIHNEIKLKIMYKKTIGEKLYEISDGVGNIHAETEFDVGTIIMEKLKRRMTENDIPINDSTINYLLYFIRMRNNTPPDSYYKKIYTGEK